MKNYNTISSLPVLPFGQPKSIVSPERPAILDTLIPKRKIFYWADSPECSTGFGVVSKNLLWGLHQTGRYEIDVLGVNYMGSFYDKSKFPYQIVPARMRDPNDPYGRQMFLECVANKDYDIILIMNDTFIVETITAGLFDVIQQKVSRKAVIPRVVYYYPIDCRAMPSAISMIQQADGVVAYSDFAIRETEKVCQREGIQRIYLGVNTETFHPLPLAERLRWRAEYLGVRDDTFVFINVARNSPRKDLAKTIIAFNEFHKKYPKSMLYLHTAVRDTGAGTANIVDLSVVVQHLGLSGSDCIRFPANFHPAKGYDEVILNRLYNCADCFISSHTGEGFGVTTLESMAINLPLVQPNNTVTPELLGSNDERGYTYQCKEPIYLDNSGIRWVGRLEDIVATMERVYLERGTMNQAKKITAAAEFAKTLDWKNINQLWIKYLDDLMLKPFYSSARVKNGEGL